MSKQLQINGDTSNPCSGNEKLSSFGGVLEDLGLSDRLQPEFFGTKYSELFVKKDAAASKQAQYPMIYCLPGQQNFYDIIPQMPRDIR